MYQLYLNENVDKKDLKVFIYCGLENIPSQCFCGCGLTRLFTAELQAHNYSIKNKYRFFQNTSHIKRFISKN